MPYALFLFIAMPIIEIAVLLRVGDAIGWLPTLIIVVVTAIAGTSILRQQGLATLNTARARLDAGEMPAQQMMEGLLIVVGGVLLLTPGFVTDTFGFLCLIPFTRQWLIARLSSRVNVGVVGQGAGVSPGGRVDAAGKAQPGHTANTSRTGKRASEGDVIDGDFKVIDDD